MMDYVDDQGRKLLWYACKNGDLDTVRELVEHHPANVFEDSIFFIAIEAGHKARVHYLLSRGYYPSRIDYHHEIPLHVACHSDHLGSVNLLLQYAADPNMSTSCKTETALHVAYRRGHLDIVNVPLKHDAGPTKCLPLSLPTCFSDDRNKST
jgi:ankyrin repeat protein